MTAEAARREHDRTSVVREAERYLLGGLILDPDRIADVAATLRGADFYDRTHGALFALLCTMSREGRGIDAVTVPEAVFAGGSPERYGGLGYVAELPDRVSATANLAHYAEIVGRHSVARRAIGLLQTALADADRTDDPAAVIDRAVAALSDLHDGLPDGRTGHVSEATHAATDAHEDAYQDRSAHEVIASGLPSLDGLLQMHRGDLVVLAARPSMGKTALALNIAWNAAAAGGVVGVVEMEMSREQMVNRLVAARAAWRLSGVGPSVTNPRAWGQPEWDRWTSTVAEIDKLSLYMDDRPRLAVEAILSRGRAWKLRHGRIDLLVVDYLGLMPTHPGRRAEDTGHNAEGLKRIARVLDCPVLAVHSIARRVEERSDKVPLLSDLKDSGDIELHADAVAFVHRPYYYDRRKPPRDASVHVAKQRMGCTGTCELDWWGETQVFAERKQQQVGAGP